MREIKFRMWNKEIKEMYDVGLINFQQRLIFMKHYEGYTQSSFALEDVELMQYTGLHDKNGKEVYEGDILKFKMYNGKYGNYKIVFRNAEFEAINEDDTNFISADIWNVYGEVIGNIYENPELLERSSNED